MHKTPAETFMSSKGLELSHRAAMVDGAGQCYTINLVLPQPNCQCCCWKPKPPPGDRIFCRRNQDYSLMATNGTVVPVLSERDNKFQRWIKDPRYSTAVKDADGFPTFALLNEATGEAMKSNGVQKPVSLVLYNPDQLDRSILWSEGNDTGGGFRNIRMLNEITYVLDLMTRERPVPDGEPVGPWQIHDLPQHQWKIQSWDAPTS